MAGFERYIARLTSRVEQRVDGAIDRLRGPRSPRQIAAYRGFGTDSEVFVSGRVLANEPPGAASAGDSWLRNLHNTYRRLESDELPGIVVRAALAGVATEAVTDEEGFFRAWIRLPQPLPRRLWHEGVLQVTPDGGPPIVQPFHVLTPPPAAAFGIISDLDDTVIHTRATSPLHMARDILFGNARTRLPFHGVAAFYRALHDGTGADPLNPIFYVSSSPWNLYDLLTDFLEHQRVPLGPLMLRDWGITETEILPTGHKLHKGAAIRLIMETYPRLPFILIGDSGQQDPEIYRDVVHAMPNRILAVYIRNVTPDPLRKAAINDLAEEIKNAGSTLVLADDTLACARHAVTKGWIPESALADIAEEEKADKKSGDSKAETVVIE
jgi:phosphatidate phosphatase APP1